MSRPADICRAMKLEIFCYCWGFSPLGKKLLNILKASGFIIHLQAATFSMTS